MSESTTIEVLRTSIPTLVPVWLLAIATRVVFDVSHWLGGTLAILLFIVVCRAVNRFNTARNVSVEVREVILVNALIPILAALSVFAVFYYPAASTPFNILLIATALPAERLIQHVHHKLNKSLMLLCSSSLLVESVLATGLFYLHGTSVALPTITLVIYSLDLVWETIGELHEKLPISALRMVFFVCSIIGAPLSYASYFTTFAYLCPILTTTTIVVFFLFIFCDFWWFQMQLPESDKIDRKIWLCKSINHICAELCAVAFIASCGWMTDFSDNREDFPGKAGLAALIFFVFIFIRKNYQKHEPPQSEGEPMRQETARTIAAIIAIIALMICIACFYVIAEHSTVFPPFLIRMTIGALFLLLSQLLDSMRGFLVPYKDILLVTALGLSLYMAATSKYLFHCGTLLNDATEWRSADTLRETTPVIRVLLCTAMLCFGIGCQFLWAFEQEEKKSKREAAAAAAAVREEDIDDSDGDIDIVKPKIA